MIEKLCEETVREVRGALSGSRLEKFDGSVEVLNASLRQGGWLLRGKVRAESGFYQGLIGRPETTNPHKLYMCLRYGQPCALIDATYEDVKRMVTRERVRPNSVKVTTKLLAKPSEVYAWIRLCRQRAEVVEALDAMRPPPVVTAVGLSPKVTKTLTECGLDLDLSSIKMAEIECVWVQSRGNIGQLLFKRDGVTPVMEPVYFVKWSEGIRHNQSRFAHGGGCHACSKQIPSCRFVPVEARRKSGELVSMWLGCDCAKNIFGIKDVGLDKHDATTPF